MKIGLVCPYNMSRGGAVIEIVKDMRAGLITRGHTVKIITGRPRNANGVNSIGVPPDDVVFTGGVFDFRSPTHTLASFTVSRDVDAATAKVEAEQFDILHFHEPAVPLLSKQILDRSTSVNIATFHAKLPDTVVSQTIGRVFVPYLRSILGDLDELTVGSDAAAEYIRTLTDRPLHYIPNGIDLETFQSVRRAAPGSHKSILYVGRLEHRKGVKYLIQAFALLAREHDDVELIIAGAGPDRAKLETLVTGLGLRNVTFLGFIDNGTKRRLLAEADLFCAPSIFGESFGLVLLEAMATGLVTVAGNNPGYAAVMQGKGTISLVNPRDIPDFARRLNLLLNEEHLRKQWRTWALDYVRQFDYRGIIEQYETLYEKALKSRRRVVVR
ncbi:MAG TPA: glycosyltransferase family 4 protein [Verrucomicrobiae bacterium]|nr:glycosyltransferase family 4 protein [Verrucomicrobiae bacterium]